MLDLTSDRGRLISAALGLAAERAWTKVTLADIAERAGSTLVALKGEFASKGDILAAFTRLVDDEVLRRAPRRSEQTSPRDALFEVVMSRFDVLEPYKGALRSITSSGLPDPALIGPMYAAQGWMLEAAGIGSEGIDGHVRAAGLATVYAAVFRTWLDDEDPGLARTMAALDRRLRRGQRSLERMESVVGGLGRFATVLSDAVRGRTQKPAPPSSPPETPAPPETGSPPPQPAA